MKRFSRAAMVLASSLLAVACSDDAGGGGGPAGPGTPARIASIQLEPGEFSLALGQDRKLTAAVRDEAGRSMSGVALSWSSSAEDVVTVGTDGTVRAIAEGQASITATADGQTGRAVVTVAPPVASVEVVVPLDTLEAYDQVPMQAILRAADGRVLTGRQIQWQSSDPRVASIDPATGLLTGHDRGTVTVTATSEDRSGEASRVVVIRYRSMTAGSMHACNLASGGIAWCWGLNGREGRIGGERLHETEQSSVPVRVPGDHRFAQLATFGVTTCGVTREGKAYCWGGNGWGVLGTGASQPAQSRIPVAVTGGHTFKQIAAGGGHFCGLTTAGAVYCWGYNNMGELGNESRTASSTPVRAAPLLTFASLTAGDGYTCGITTAGQGYCWGYNGAGNLGDGNKISFGNTFSPTPTPITGGHRFAQLSAAQRHTCGVTTSGQGLCWGRNSGALGNGQTTETSVPSPIAGGHNVKGISTGHSHSCIVTATGEVHCWGANRSGQLGSSNENGSIVPVRITSDVRAAEVAAANMTTGSGSYTCAISADRLTSYCWGRNDVGQLGNGLTSGPTAMNPNATIVQGQKPL